MEHFFLASRNVAFNHSTIKSTEKEKEKKPKNKNYFFFFFHNIITKRDKNG